MLVSLEISLERGSINGSAGSVLAIAVLDGVVRIYNGGAAARWGGPEDYTKNLVMIALVVSCTR
jgi:hypothetical protein